ncbi:MAG TPA: hypothetical protein VNT25_00775 [Allosphingosinicella sp.]|nr:hypothetical protein [Allosphingosinicella sp.]
MFDRSDIQRVIASAVFALIFSATMVGSAVGPARAIETTKLASVSTQFAAEANA